jgi:hypothetical protein
MLGDYPLIFAIAYFGEPQALATGVHVEKFILQLRSRTLPARLTQFGEPRALATGVHVKKLIL